MMRTRRMWQGFGLLALLLGAFLAPPPPVARPAPAAQSGFCLEAPQPPGATDRAASPSGELSLAQKRAAFAEVAARPSYGDYRYPLQVTSTQSTTVQSILLQAVAGIESDWEQYEVGVTKLNRNPTGTCDHGLMQINDSASGFLFTKQPSLRSDTRANIAAGATILTDRWNQGVLGPLPLVNDGDPDLLINWYYALSAYNGGPNRTTRSWANNPNCTQQEKPQEQILVCGSKIDYRPSRAITTSVTWMNTPAQAFPYQERALYNLAFPLTPGGAAQWLAAGLGLLATTSPGDTGLRPDDAIFLTKDSSGATVSFAPNLLLFRHRAAPVQPGVRNQTLRVEYDLPFAATVTLALRSQSGQETPLCRQAGQAGWNVITCVVAPALQLGDTYVLRAERGNTSDLVSYYLGQYVQSLNFQSLPAAAPLNWRVHLPIVRNTVAPVGLRNSRFIFSDPREGWKPDYWDVQALVPRDGAGNLGGVTEYVRQSTTPLGWGFYAAPLARIDMRQRVNIPAGRYMLTVNLARQGSDAASLLLLRTRPATPGPQPWTTVGHIPVQGSPNFVRGYPVTVTGPTLFSLVVLFGPTDRQSQIVLREVQLSR